MVTLTESAAAHAKKFLLSDSLGIRVKVRNTGCSGFGYRVEVVKTAHESDVVYVSNGVNIIIDQVSLLYIDGTEIDLESNGLNQVFVYRNPNVISECGCGESFTVK